MLLRESETIELKEIYVEDIRNEIIAFANTNGGTLYIGIKDDGSIIGVDNSDKLMLQVSNMVRDAIKPDLTMFVNYTVQTISEKSVIKISVQRGTNRPYYLAKNGLKPSGVFVRQGTSAAPASENVIRQMIKETDGDSFEQERSLEQNLTFNDAKEEFLKRKITFGLPQMKTLGIISNDEIYTNVGRLLSDQCYHTIKVAVFSSTDQSKFQDRKEFKGSILKQMEAVYSYISMKNSIKASFEGLYRKDKYDYPEVALREALLNSLVHRDYSYSTSSFISIYDDRIEFVSIGGLLPGIYLEDVMLGLSVCRNSKLADIFYRLKLIEAYGTGLQKIISAYEDCKEKPKIEVTHNAFKIILPNQNYYMSSKKFVEDESLSKNEIIILNFARDNESLVRGDVDILLKVSLATSNRLLKKMVQKGLLIQIGKGPTTRYCINKEYK